MTLTIPINGLARKVWAICSLLVCFSATLAYGQPGDIHSRTRRLDPDTGSREASGTTMPYRRDTIGGPRISERNAANEDPDDYGSTRPSSSDAGEYKLDAIGGSRISSRGNAKQERESYEQTRRNWLEANAGDRREDENVHRRFNPRDYRAADMELWLEARGTRGLAVAYVAPTGPFGELDVREGDRVLAVNGVRVYRENEFMQYLFEDDLADEEAWIGIERDGERHTIALRPSGLIRELQSLGEDPSLKLGLVLDGRRRNYLMVAAVLPRSPAYYAGVQPGDTLTMFDAKIVTSPRELAAAVEATKPGDVEMQVERSNRIRRLVVDVPNAEATSRRIAETRTDPDRKRQATISTDDEIDASSSRLTPDAARPVLRRPADQE